MKIGIITYAFYESTLPLFKHLSENKKDEVHLYCIFNERFLNCPGFDLSKSEIKLKSGMEEIENHIIPSETKSYLAESLNRTHVYVHKVTLPYILGLQNKLSRDVSSQNFDLIHFIGYSTLYLPIAKTCLAKIVVSLHETNMKRIKLNTKWPVVLIKELMISIQNRLVNHIDYFTFFSENEEYKFIHLNPQYTNKTSVIKFGIFESYQHLQHDDRLPVKHKDYILYLGLIREYKGVKFLLDTISQSVKLSSLKFVVAGKDEIGISEHIPNNVDFFNQFLTDQQMIALIKDCRFLVLPYTSASQSGLPCLALQFGKPFVFSDVPGLDEYLSTEYNGLSFKSHDKQSLEEAILKLMDPIEYQKIQSNILTNPFNYPSDWNLIAANFRACYDQLFRG